MKKAIWFDMDGTIANLYAVDGWLNDLNNEKARPYLTAKVMLNMNTLARLLNKVQKNGYSIGIISWTSKNGSAAYNEKVATAKKVWLSKHLNSVKWDAIKVVPYGTNKNTACGGGILFDDEEGNRKAWTNGIAYTPDNIMTVLKKL